MAQVKATCCYCGVGCGVLVETDGEKIIDVKGDPAHPANFGRLCTKGSTLHLTATAEGRALYPELRLVRGAPKERAGWEETLDYVAERFARIIKEHGPDSVAFYISGQLLTEDYYVFNKLAKGLIGTNNVDTNSRLCMSSAVAGYKKSLGVDAPPACYDDLDSADCIFIAGANTAYAHPVLFRRLEEARARNPAQRLIVVDPRRTDTARTADLHLAILPGTDVALFNGMLHVLLWEGLCDRDYIARHTEGFDAVQDSVREYTPKRVAEICGVAETDILTAARWFGRSAATLSLYCQGLNQSVSGTAKNVALLNLHLATGQIGRPGAGPLSLTGQPNAMGGREVGGMANLLPAHRDLANPEHRAEVARLWGVDRIPAEPGKMAVDMFEALRAGSIKAIWIACTNPAQSLPDQTRVREALAGAEFVVVQEAFRYTDTTAYADVLLPASTWAEKEGTVTNSERRITHLHPAVAPPGEARADWRIVVDFARRLEHRLGRDGESLFPYAAPEEIFNEHRETTRGRDLDITGLSYARLDREGPQQWPCPEGAPAGRARLYEDGIFPTPSGRARFGVTPYLPTRERADARFPLHLNTGRLRDQWHGMSRTGRVGRLYSHVEAPLLSMHPQDLARRGLAPGDLARITSRTGALLIRVEASDDLRPAQTFLPMHWGSRFMSGPGCNVLIAAAVDPVSGQPELKHAAVDVEKVVLPWQIVIMRQGAALERLYAAAPLLQKLDYATVGLYGRDNSLVVFQGAHHGPLDAQTLAEFDAVFGLGDGQPMMIYEDSRRGTFRRVLVEAERVTGVRLTGNVRSQGWLKELMSGSGRIDTVRSWLLAPVSEPPGAGSGRGRIVCNCLDVAQSDIELAIQGGANVEDLQKTLKCGTQCGSCLPEVRRLTAAGAVPQKA